MNIIHYFWNNFKKNLRALSSWFLTKHRVNKNVMSLERESWNQCSDMRPDKQQSIDEMDKKLKQQVKV